jgi:hypothetical protein
MERQFSACNQQVYNRGHAPDAFLDEFIDWAQAAPAEIFHNNGKFDAYSSVVERLGPSRDDAEDPARTRGLESSWEWSAAWDISNPSFKTPCAEEVGIFQCSGNSMKYTPTLKELLS